MIINNCIYLQIPEASMVYVNEDATFQAIILPDNGEIILGANVAINLSEDPQCDGELSVHGT